MEKVGAGGLILVAIVMLTTGFVLRWDLIDWLIDAVGFLFIAGGAITGVVGLIKLMGGRGREATSV
jgi:hypothetical protein